MIVWPAVYTGGALIAAAVLCHDAFAGRKGRLGDALRLLPGVALVLGAAAARTSGLLSSEPGVGSLWAEVLLLRPDLGSLVLWGLAGAFLPPLAPETPVGTFLRGLVSGGFRPTTQAGPPSHPETAGAVLSPVVWLPIALGWVPYGGLVPGVVYTALLVLVMWKRGKTSAASTWPLERALVGGLAVGLAHLGGAFVHLESVRAPSELIALGGVAVGVLCEPVIVAVAVGRALHLTPSLAGYAPVFVACAFVGRAAFVLSRAALARRQ